MTGSPEKEAGSAANPRAEGAFATLTLSAFGLGLSPIMPGTVASLATALAFWLFPTSVVSTLALAALLIAYGVVVTLRYAGRVSGADGHGDPGWVVSDEVAGQALACVGAVGAPGWLPLVAAFVAFRLLDILKPGPVGRAEKLPGGMGVLMDDVVAGALAAVLVLVAGLLGWFELLG